MPYGGVRKRLAVTALIFPFSASVAAGGRLARAIPSPTPTPTPAARPTPSTVSITGSTDGAYAFAPRTVHVKKGEGQMA